MDKPSPRDLTRRAAVLGLGALGGCVSAPSGIPNAPFSLTVWAWGEKIEFLLLNATDQPLQLASPFAGPRPSTLNVRVRDDTGAALTINPQDEDFVAPYADAATPAPAFRRLAPWKALKGTLQTADLVEHLRLGPGLDHGRVYALEFRLGVIGLRPDKSTFDARVRSRSQCAWRFEGAALRTECKSG